MEFHSTPGFFSDSNYLFLFFFFFFKSRADSGRVEKKTRPESARVSPSRAESARLGSRRPPHSKIFSKKNKTIDGSRPESGRVFGKSGSRADSGRLFFIFFFFQKSGRLGPSRKKNFFFKKSRPESKKKVGPSRPESARVGPSRPDSGPVGPPTVKSFPKKKKPKKNKTKKKNPKKKNQKKFDSARLGPTFFLSRAEFFRLGPTRADPEKKIFEKKNNEKWSARVGPTRPDYHLWYVQNFKTSRTRNK